MHANCSGDADAAQFEHLLQRQPGGADGSGMAISSFDGSMAERIAAVQQDEIKVQAAVPRANSGGERPRLVVMCERRCSAAAAGSTKSQLAIADAWRRVCTVTEMPLSLNAMAPTGEPKVKKISPMLHPAGYGS